MLQWLKDYSRFSSVSTGLPEKYPGPLNRWSRLLGRDFSSNLPSKVSTCRMQSHSAPYAARRAMLRISSKRSTLISTVFFIFILLYGNVSNEPRPSNHYVNNKLDVIDIKLWNVLFKRFSNMVHQHVVCNTNTKAHRKIDAKN